MQSDSFKINCILTLLLRFIFKGEILEVEGFDYYFNWIEYTKEWHCFNNNKFDLKWMKFNRFPCEFIFEPIICGGFLFEWFLKNDWPENSN